MPLFVPYDALLIADCDEQQMVLIEALRLQPSKLPAVLLLVFLRKYSSIVVKVHLEQNWLLVDPDSLSFQIQRIVAHDVPEVKEGHTSLKDASLRAR